MQFARAVLLLGLTIAPTSFAQTSAENKCRLEGQIVNAITGIPLRKAVVTLFDVAGADATAPSRHPAQEQADHENPVAVTNVEGHFTFAGLEPGSYGLSVARPGFRQQSYGIPWAAGSGEPVRLAAGDSKTGVVIKLMPLGVIAGRMVDEDGDPIRHVNVSALAYVSTPDGRQLAPRGNSSTNDLGEYRIFDLAAGKYYLKAEPTNTRQFGAAPTGKKTEDTFLATFYPGSPDESGAERLELTPGSQLQGLDLTMRKGHFVAVLGRIFAPDGAANANVILVQHQDGGSSTTTFGANADGSFQMRGLEPGDYVVGARCEVDGKPYEVSMPLIVGTADITGLELRPMPPLSVTGKLRTEGTASAKLSNIVVTLDAKLGFVEGSGNVHEDGTFSVRDMPRDIYEVRFGNIPGMFVKSIHLGSADIRESGLDLTTASGDVELSILLSANVATVDGGVLNEKGEPASYARVALIPQESANNSNARRDRWPRADTNTDSAGHFAIKDLAPGSYRVYAWQRSEGDSGRVDPEFLKANESQSEGVDLAEGEHKRVQLKLIPRRQEEQ